MWIDDHGWWLILVSFEPSGWSRGSHLHVGPMWLWREKDHFSYDSGRYRDRHFEFKDNEQFTAVAVQPAEKAASGAKRLRNLFADLESVASHLRREPDRTTAGWPAFHAGAARS